jgi:hypothetical protein
MPRSSVDGEVAERVALVVVGGAAVDPQGVEAGVAGYLGDGDEVFVATETGRERFTNHAEWVRVTTGG